MGGLRTLVTGACCAWPLPTDASCARAARRFYREAAAEAGIRPGLIDDGVLMASELAANTLHARGDVSGPSRPATARPELWLYLRGSGMTRELVCKVFDASPGWRPGRTPGAPPPRAAAEATSGRGLQVVHELVSPRTVGPSPHPGQARRAEGTRQGGLVRASRSVAGRHVPGSRPGGHLGGGPGRDTPMPPAQRVSGRP